MLERWKHRPVLPQPPYILTMTLQLHRTTVHVCLTLQRCFRLPVTLKAILKHSVMPTGAIGHSEDVQGSVRAYVAQPLEGTQTLAHRGWDFVAQGVK